MKCCYCKRIVNKEVAVAHNADTNKRICVRCVVALHGKIITDFMEIAHAHPRETKG